MMDTFGGVMVDSQDELTVQSLLSLPESSAMGLSGELMAQAAFIQGPPTEITLDEDDVFQCGKCKKVFTSFQLFMYHKKKHQLPASLALPLDDDLEGTVIEEPLQVPQQSCEETQSQTNKGALHFSSLEDDSFVGLSSDIGQPVLLEDQDPLSFSIDQGVLNLSAAQLPEGSYVSSSLTTLPSVSEAIKSHEGNTSDTNTTWLLTKQDDNLNLVATNYADDRTLYLDDEQKCVVGVGSSKSNDKVPTDLEFTGDDLLSEVPFDSGKEVFLDGSSITVQESINVDPESRVIIPSGEYMLKSGIDYINSGELLAGFEKVDQQTLVPEDQNNETVSVNVLEVEMSSIQNIVGLPAESLESPSIEAFSDESLSQDNGKKKKRPKAKKTTRAAKPVDSSPSYKQYKCGYCAKWFAKNFDLQQHLRSHTGEKPFQCVVCGRAFAQKSNVKKHMKSHQVWPKGIATLPKVIVQEVSKSKTDESDKKTDGAEEICEGSSAAKEGPEYIIDNSYTCQYCDASHDSYFGLKAHLKTHLSQKVYWCNQQNCMNMFPDLDSFLEHTQIHIQKEAQYRCHVCKLTFKTLSDLGIHQYTHSAKEKPVTRGSAEKYVCVKCRSRFTSPENLEQHLATASHHHPCPECKRVFTCERNLRRHLLTHSTTYAYTCKDCGKNFRTETYLNMHRVMHSSEKPFVCEHCSAAFNRKDRLSRHLLIHQAVKKYKCPFHSPLNCSREFNRQDKLKLHILTHLTHGSKDQQCQYCKKEFRKVSVLRRHERKCPGKPAKMNATVAHRKSVKRKEDSSVDPTLDNPSDPVCLDDPVLPQALIAADKQAKKSTRKSTKMDNLSTVSFKVGPKSQTTRKRRNLLEIAAADANLQTSNSNENVPTIEIIVMPLSLNVRTEDMDDSIEGGVSNETGMYRVMFPPDNSEYPVDLTTGNDTLLSRVECEREGGVLIGSSEQEVAVYSANAGIQKL